LVVISAEIRAQIAEHAREELPNEACGLVLLDGDRAVEYVPAANAAASPYRFTLFLEPSRWADLGDTDFDQAVVHSHPSSAPRPSRTDVENVGLWEGRPYLIYSVREDVLSAWTIADGSIQTLEIE
jgi:proteasome lid subunit RPN8/RPN11